LNRFEFGLNQEDALKLIRRWSALWITLGLVTVLLGAPWLMLWRQYRLDHDLVAAVRRNDTQTAIALLNRGADANARAETRGAPSPWRLLWDRLRGKPAAAATGSTPLLILLEPTGNDGTAGSVHYLPDNLPITAALLDHGANINMLNQQGFNPLNLAILSKKEQTVHLLLARGADVRPVRFGTRKLLSVPLIWACGASHCSPEVIADLLDHGANINDQDYIGQTPLFAAVTRFRPAVVRQLLARHPDLTPRDIHGKTVLMWVEHFRNAPQLREIAPLIEQAAAKSAGSSAR
jgi:ankyrin repeat protein